MENQAPLSLLTELDRLIRPKAARMAGLRGVRNAGGKPSDWQPDTGIVNQMLAYSDWWNMPSTRSRASTRAPRPDRG